MLNGLDLFSGIGGLTLALGAWVVPVAYCENDRFAQGVLQSRMRDGRLPSAPIWDDVRTLSGKDFSNIDIIYGGFPCQDLSVAGTGKGLDGERSGLFFEVARLTKEIRPAFVFLENVPGIRTKGLGSIVKELAHLGYDCRWTVVSAGEVGACHIRKRWFLLAHSNSMQLRQECGAQVRRTDSFGPGPVEHNSSSKARRITWPPERRSQPRVDRTGDGFSSRLDRARCLGNAVHPAQAKAAFKRLIGLEGEINV